MMNLFVGLLFERGGAFLSRVLEACYRLNSKGSKLTWNLLLKFAHILDTLIVLLVLLLAMVYVYPLKSRKFSTFPYMV